MALVFEDIDPATGMLLPVDVVPEADVGPMGGMYSEPIPAAGPSMDEQLVAAEQAMRPPPEVSFGSVGAAPQMDEATRLRAEGLDLIGLAGKGEMVRSKRPLHAETNQRIDVGEQASQQSAQAQKQQLVEQETTARWMAGEMEQHAQRMQEAMVDERAAQYAEAERRERIIREAEQQDLRVTQAAQHLNNAPPLDPGRWWKDQSAGRKAGFVIASIFMGMAHQDPLKLINTAIERDILAQQTDYQRRKDTLTAEGQRLEQKSNLWADIRANALTDDEARLQVKNAYLESFKQHIVAGLHERGVAELQPMHQQILAQIEDQQAQNTLRWQQLRAANTKYVYSKSYAVGDPATRKSLRRLGEKEYEAGIAEGADVRKSGRDLGNTLTAQAHKAQLDAPAPGEMSKDDRLDIRALRADDKYSAAVDMLGHLDRMIEISNKHGGTAPDVYGPLEIDDKPLVGPPLFSLKSEDKEAWDLESKNAEQIWINRLTGAVSDDDQKEISKALTGQKGLSAGARVRAIKRAREIVKAFIKQKTGHLSQQAQQRLSEDSGRPAGMTTPVVDDEYEVEFDE